MFPPQESYLQKRELKFREARSFPKFAVRKMLGQKSILGQFRPHSRALSATSVVWEVEVVVVGFCEKEPMTFHKCSQL